MGVVVRYNSIWDMYVVREFARISRVRIYFREIDVIYLKTCNMAPRGDASPSQIPLGISVTAALLGYSAHGFSASAERIFPNYSVPT